MPSGHPSGVHACYSKHVICVIIAVVLFVTSANNPFVLDDHRAVRDNPELMTRPFYFAEHRPVRANLPHSDPSRPLSFLTYSFNALIFGQVRTTCGLGPRLQQIGGGCRQMLWHTAESTY